MLNVRDLIDVVRYQINQNFNIDVVWASGQHTLRAHIYKVIKDYAIDAIIDVGANEGHFASQVRKLGFKGEIYSFEPVAEVFGKLSLLAAKDAKWNVYNFALGDEAVELMINVSRFSQFSSILNANERGNSLENMQVGHQQKVKIKTLDECFHEGLIPNQRRFLLKMDTQGYDLKVFKGASKSLPNVCCMLSELSLIPIYHGMPHYLESLSVYESKGFSVSGFYPITRNRKLALEEVDCMLVNVQSL